MPLSKPFETIVAPCRFCDLTMIGLSAVPLAWVSSEVESVYVPFARVMTVPGRALLKAACRACSDETVWADAIAGDAVIAAVRAATANKPMGFRFAIEGTEPRPRPSRQYATYPCGHVCRN